MGNMQLAANVLNAPAAVALAQLYLQQARSLGDARFAGRAMGVLAAWRDPDKAPVDVLMMLATVQQYLHAFDTAAGNLERLLQREPLHAQALLTLATVRRVQGRYTPSDAACQMLQRAGQSLYARACNAENRGLRGETDAARSDLQALLARLDTPLGERGLQLSGGERSALRWPERCCGGRGC